MEIVLQDVTALLPDFLANEWRNNDWRGSKDLFGDLFSRELKALCFERPIELFESTEISPARKCQLDTLT